MRVGMFSWESLYSIKVGGVAPHVSELSEALARRGHELHIFTRRGDFDSYDKINGVHYQRIDFDSTGDLLSQMVKMSSAMYDRFRAVQAIFGKFDVIHAHDWHPVNALNSIKSEYGLSYILTMHSTEWGRNGNNWGGGISKEVSHLEWLGCYLASEIIVTTQRMKDELSWAYNVPDYKLNIIPNGIIKGKMRRMLDAGRVKERYGIHPLAPLVLFCGRMSFQKGPDLLVEAIPYVLRKRGDVRFLFMGEGDMKAYCERRAQELHVSRTCRFLGYSSSAGKEELMNACDLVCIPSRNEPFGVVVLEAWDACKPVVATESISIIKNFEDGLLAYVQPESLAWCINYLLENPIEMKRLAQFGCDRIESEFSWDRIAKRTERVYEKSMLRIGSHRSEAKYNPSTENYKNSEHKGLLTPR
ncbi:MAG: glycosyltransferase family 4 protein [Methanotrichaceae archaeon]|nr:glycosyltransferase family 4 protein [Methanotrichaceae archaeon]